MQQTTRRTFLKTTAAGIGYWVAPRPIWSASRSPNEKLNLATIGAGGKGTGDTHGCKSENIVALCDVDWKYASKTFAAFPKANVYRDYRVMLEKEKLDAVVVSTPDHMHAPITLMAMRMGIHVYCQKPMGHTIQETRLLRDVAREQKVVTQMGNQGTSMDNMRRAVELVQGGALGTVREAHVWTNRPIWPQGGQRPVKPMRVPENLDWNLWLGCAPYRPFHEDYLPFKWRGWWDFGEGALGDMGCHNLNLPFWALELGAPSRVEGEARGLTAEMFPLASRIRYQFPARTSASGRQLPPVTLYWYDGDQSPPRELLDGLPADKKLSTNGVLMIGSEGKIFAPSSHCRLYELWPKEKFAEYEGPAQTLPRSPGHYKEWIAACKGGPATLSNFDVAARLTEIVLLGNVALRAGTAIEWDTENSRVTNAPAANQFLSREYRDGWM
jgi:hypothetical protein